MGLLLKLAYFRDLLFMYIMSKGIILVINSTLLQASTKLADWRSMIPYLLGLKSLVARLPSCLCGDTVRRTDTALAGTYEHRPSRRSDI